MAGDTAKKTSPENDSLRILFAVDSVFPRLGGAENQALKLAVALRQKGVEVEFVTPRILPEQSLQETYQGFLVQRVDYPHVKWIGSLVLMIWFARYLLANRERFDALHIHITHLLAASAGILKPWLKIPVITKVSGFYEFEGGILDHKKRFFPLNGLLRWGIRKVDHVQTISQQTKDKLLQAGFKNRQILFIPNGIDTKVEPSESHQSTEFRIGYCGRLREVKGVHFLLEAYAAVIAARPEHTFKLVIAGSGETESALIKQAHDLGIAHQIDYLGFLEDPRPFFQSIDLYVQPSLAEGLPNSVMEAMLEQLPVLVSKVGGNAELVEHEVTGLSFQAGNVTELTQQILRLFNDKVLREKVAKAGRQLIVDRYDFDQITAQLMDVYRVKG